MKNHSSLTFGEIAENLDFVQVVWNKKLVFDDYDGDSSLQELHEFEDKYYPKLVYKMLVTVVGFHHCILEVEGEK